MNAAGLVISLTCGLLVAQYLSYELSYDSFHEEKELIYRVYRESHMDDGINYSPGLVSGMVPMLSEQRDDIEGFARLLRSRDFFEVSDRSIEANLAYADSSFFLIFNFPLSAGRPADLNGKKNIVFVSKGFARKMFNDAEPLGQRLNRKGVELEVTGVFENIVGHSHIQADVILPFGLLPVGYHNFPEFDDTDCYLKLRAEGEKMAVEEAINTILDEHQYGIKKPGQTQGALFKLQPLQRVHLHSADFIGIDSENPGSIEVFIMLGVFALLIMTMSWFNYINLSLANALQRGKEVGIRRVIGARKWQIHGQFFTETFLLICLSFVLAFTLYQFLTPELAGLFNIQTVSFFNDPTLMQYWPFQLFFLLLLLSAAGASLYLGTITTSFKAITALRGGLTGITKGFSFKKGLMMIQFVIAIFAITTSGLIQRQIDYVLTRDYGVDTNGVIVFKYDRSIQKKISPEVFVNKVRSYPFVDKVSLSSNVPGMKGTAGRGGVSVTTKTDEEGRKVLSDPTQFLRADEHFFELYDIGLIAGSNFVKGSTNKDLVLINEKYALNNGYNSAEEAIGKEFGKKKIIGVFEDFHSFSTRTKTMAMVLEYSAFNRHAMFSVKIKPGMMEQAYSMLKADWQEVFETQRNPPVLLKEHIENEYNSDKTFAHSVHLLTIITLFISIIGLVGITHLSVIHRLKEIGLRKIMGARWLNVMTIFGRGYISLIILSIVIAVPVSVLFFQEWITRFIYQAQFSYLLVAITVSIVLFLSMFILVYQASRSFKVRPVDALRYE